MAAENTPPASCDMVQLVRPADAARLLAIGKRKLWAMTNAGELPCVRIGRAVRYDLDDLREWIDARKDSPR